MASTWRRSESLQECRPSSSLLRSSSVTCVKQSALIGLLSVCIDCCVLWSVHVCVFCQIPSPCLVSVLQTGEGRRMSACQYPAASLSLAFGAHRAVLSVCCTCQGGMWEMRGWREEDRSEAPSFSCYVGLKIDSILPSFLFPVHLCFHTQRPSPDLPLCFPLILVLFPPVSLFGLSKHALWCPMIRLLQCNARQFGHC